MSNCANVAVERTVCWETLCYEFENCVSSNRNRLTGYISAEVGSIVSTVKKRYYLHASRILRRRNISTSTGYDESRSVEIAECSLSNERTIVRSCVFIECDRHELEQLVSRNNLIRMTAVAVVIEYLDSTDFETVTVQATLDANLEVVTKCAGILRLQTNFLSRSIDNCWCSGRQTSDISRSTKCECDCNCVIVCRSTGVLDAVLFRSNHLRRSTRTKCPFRTVVGEHIGSRYALNSTVEHELVSSSTGNTRSVCCCGARHCCRLCPSVAKTYSNHAEFHVSFVAGVQIADCLLVSNLQRK